MVVHPEDLDFCQEKVIAPYALKKVLRLVPGGKERQDSVYHALKALQKEEDLEIILVHDGVRPFVTPEQVSRVIDAARSHGAAVLGLPAQDTLKRVTPRQGPPDPGAPGCLADPDPPGLPGGPLVAALPRPRAAYYGTDEASLVEALDQPVVVVPGSPEPEDHHPG